MANVRQVFEKIVDNYLEGAKKQVQIHGVATKNDYETLRTRLVRFFTEHKEIVLAVGGEDSDPLLELSLCGDYDQANSTATFFLGHTRRKRAKAYEFSIVDVPATGTQVTPVNEEPPSAVNDDANTIPPSKLA